MSILFLANIDEQERCVWTGALRASLPDDAILAWTGEPASAPAADMLAGVTTAVVANPPPGRLARLPALRFVQSAWAGVDALLADASLPAIPLARLVDPQLAADMAEAVLGHVLALHRQMPAYRAQQRRVQWQPLPQPRLAQRCVGLLGMGEMGQASAALLARTGFDVIGWSRRPRPPLAGVTMVSGAESMAQVLSRAGILVNLLPLTPQTRGLLNVAAFATMPRGAGLVNAGRGGHVVVPDLLAALDAGQIGHAVLDVFTTEPLPACDPLWQRDDVTITPHVAAPTDPHSAARAIAANIARWRAGETPVGLVDRTLGY